MDWLLLRLLRDNVSVYSGAYTWSMLSPFVREEIHIMFIVREQKVFFEYWNNPTPRALFIVYCYWSHVLNGYSTTNSSKSAHSTFVRQGRRIWLEDEFIWIEIQFMFKRLRPYCHTLNLSLLFLKSFETMKENQVSELQSTQPPILPCESCLKNSAASSPLVSIPFWYWNGIVLLQKQSYRLILCSKAGKMESCIPLSIDRVESYVRKTHNVPHNASGAMMFTCYVQRYHAIVVEISYRRRIVIHQ